MPESVNRVTKIGVDLKKSEMSQFNEKIEKVIRQQRRDRESAVINRGPYAVADDYLHLQMFPDKCFSLNTRQLERHLKTFYDKYLEEIYICRMRVVIPTMMLKGTLPLSSLQSCL